MRLTVRAMLPVIATLVLGHSSLLRADETPAKLYERTLPSVVWIVKIDGDKTIAGSGALIDAERGLIVTNYHVAGDGGIVQVVFPTYKNGKLVAERDAYVNMVRGSRALRAKVKYNLESADLAICALENVPAGLRALPLAKDPVAPGQKVYSIGNPGDGGGAMWLLTEGTVRQVSKGKDRGKLFDGRILETNARMIIAQSPTNPGDSGGPLINDKGEMVGITHAAVSGARDISMFIDVAELHYFLNVAKLTIKSSTPVAANDQPPAKPPAKNTDPNAERDSAALLELGAKLVKEERYTEARPYLDIIVIKYPDSTAAARAKELLAKFPKK